MTGTRRTPTFAPPVAIPDERRQRPVLHRGARLPAAHLASSDTALMATLEQALARFGDHPGVEQVLLLGRDGLVVHRVAGGAEQAELAAAAVPAFIAACDDLGQTTGRGALRTAVLQLERGVLIAQPLSGELVLAVLLDSGAAFGPLLAELRAGRRQILELI